MFHHIGRDACTVLLRQASHNFFGIFYACEGPLTHIVCFVHLLPGQRERERPAPSCCASPPLGSLRVSPFFFPQGASAVRSEGARAGRLFAGGPSGCLRVHESQPLPPGRHGEIEEVRSDGAPAGIGRGTGHPGTYGMSTSLFAASAVADVLEPSGENQVRSSYMLLFT